MLIHMCTAAQFAGILSFGVNLSMQFTVGTPQCNAPENVLLRHGAAHGRAHKPTPSSTAKTHPLVALLVAGHGGGGGGLTTMATDPLHGSTLTSHPVTTKSRCTATIHGLPPPTHHPAALQRHTRSCSLHRAPQSAVSFSLQSFVPHAQYEA